MGRLIGNSNLKAIAILIFALLVMSIRGSAQSATKRQVVVSLEDRKLVLLENGQVKKIFPVAVGRTGSPSPTGAFEVVVRLENPTYYHPGKVIGPGASNPLGNRWIGLNQKGYGIHGTNEPKSIGKAASHGCIRMAKADLEELFTLLSVGDEVEIRGERDEQTAEWFGAPAVVMARANVSTTQAPIAGAQQ